MLNTKISKREWMFLIGGLGLGYFAVPKLIEIIHQAGTLEPCVISGKTVPCSCTTTNGKKFCVPVSNLSGLLTTKPPTDPIKAPPPNLIFDAAHGGGGL